MNKINIGLIGYGVVGRGLEQFLQKKKGYIKDKFQAEFAIRTICDRSIEKKKARVLGKPLLTTDIRRVLSDPGIDVIVELIGGLKPARDIALTALGNGKHLVTANKELIAEHGKSLFKAAHRQGRNIYFESSVMAGVPVIRTITEGVAGNQFRGLYGIINGTCNYILSEMTRNDYTFAQALADAQRKGFAESDPTKDINGMDSAHKLTILTALSLGKFIRLRDVHVEGITHISHTDIEHAERLNLAIKLLAIAKSGEHGIEARVHPTLIPKDHPLASINGIFNAIYLDTDPLGDVLLSGEGAGPMAAASGVVSDLINLASRQGSDTNCLPENVSWEAPSLKVCKMDAVLTKFYVRIMATDKPGVLSKITGILGRCGISINSVTQTAHNKMAAVPVIMLTEAAPEKMMRQALEKIHKLSTVKSKPVAIRMEVLP